MRKISITIIVEGDTEEHLLAGLRAARRAGLPVSRSHVRASSSSPEPPSSENPEPPPGDTDVEEQLKPFLSAGDLEFLTGTVKKLAEPERQVRLQARLPGKGRSRIRKFQLHVEAACTKAGLRYQDVLDVRDNGLKGASREVVIGPGPLLRKEQRAQKEEGTSV